MRSPREIAFRLGQEVRNLQLVAFPPKCHADAGWPLTGLPDPASIAQQLRSTEFATRVLQTAEEVLAHRFPLLGFALDTGPDIEWRRDYVAQLSTGTQYFRLIPYLDAKRAGDHKNIWELNRHQHLVLLAQAFRLTEQRQYLDEIGTELDSWFEANPVQRGINWASALEVAFRSLSWMWVDHLAGEYLGEERRGRLHQGL